MNLNFHYNLSIMKSKLINIMFRKFTTLQYDSSLLTQKIVAKKVIFQLQFKFEKVPTAIYPKEGGGA